MAQYKYKVFRIQGIKFIAKLDLNPITNEYDYHMYIRHLITPEQAIAAYFLKTNEIYNKSHDRYELYSTELNINCFIIKNFENPIIFV